MSNLAEGSYASVKEEKKVAVGGVSWEGSKMTFAEQEAVDVKDEKPDVAGLEPVDRKRKLDEDEDVEVTVKVEVEDKAARRARKEAKRRAKEEKRVKVEIL
jgi:hypothetical protein